jgi:hypothetical protein
MTAVTITQISPPELEALIESTFRRLIKESYVIPETAPLPKKPLCIDDAAALIGLSKHTVYGKINEIPHIKKGKKLIFFEEDLINYLKSGKQKTISEIKADAEAHLGELGNKKN